MLLMHRTLTGCVLWHLYTSFNHWFRYEIGASKRPQQPCWTTFHYPSRTVKHYHVFGYCSCIYLVYLYLSMPVVSFFRPFVRSFVKFINLFYLLSRKLLIYCLFGDIQKKFKPENYICMHYTLKLDIALIVYSNSAIKQKPFEYEKLIME